MGCISKKNDEISSNTDCFAELYPASVLSTPEKGWRTVTKKLPQWKFRNPETEPTFHSIQHTE